MDDDPTYVCAILGASRQYTVLGLAPPGGELATGAFGNPFFHAKLRRFLRGTKLATRHKLRLARCADWEGGRRIQLTLATVHERARLDRS